MTIDQFRDWITEIGVRYLLNSWASLSLLAEWDYLDGNQDQSSNDKR